MSRKPSALQGVLAGAVLTFMGTEPLAAEGLQVIDNADRFVSIVSGRELRRMGIRLTVSPEGEIAGRAFGGPVTGEWTWQNGYFCRDLYWNGSDLGYNCQLVQANGDTLRFTSDQGAGMFADLTLR